MASKERPVVKPRKKPGSNGHTYDSYDVPKSAVTFSKLSPQNIQPTQTLDRQLKVKTGSSIPLDFPEESKTLSLTAIVEKYSHLLPLRVKVVAGFMAESEGDPTICVDDVYNLHAIKQAEVVTIVDSRRQKYNLPLHSAAKFGLMGNSTDMLSVLDLQKASKLPPVITAMSDYLGDYTEYSFSSKEVLVPVEVIRRPQEAPVIRVHSITGPRVKFISEDCDILFSAHPSFTKLYLSDIIRYASHALPCQGQLYISKDHANLPKHLTSKPVAIHPKHTETSIIISLHHTHPRMRSTEKVYIDIPVSVDIDVRVLRPEQSESDYVALFQDSQSLVKEYNPKRLQACVNTNDDDTYMTQAQLFKAIRQGYESAGTKIKTSGIERDGHIYEPLTDIRAASSVYQDMVFEDAEQSKQTPQSHSTVPMYEEVTIPNEQTSPPKQRVNTPPLVSPRTKQPAPQKREATDSPTPPAQQETNPPSLATAVPEPKKYQKPMVPTPVSKKPPADRPRNPVPLPPRAKEQQQSSPSGTESIPSAPKTKEQKQSPSPGMESAPRTPNGDADEAKVPEVMVDQVKKSQQDASTGSKPLNSSDQALMAINETLRLLLSKVDNIEQKQTRFETDIAQLKSQGSSGPSVQSQGGSGPAVQSQGSSGPAVQSQADSGPAVERELPPNVHTMTQQEVLRLLEAMDMSQYKEAFSREWVDGEVLKDLDEEALQELGVASKLHRLKLMKVITGVHSLDRYLS